MNERHCDYTGLLSFFSYFIAHKEFTCNSESLAWEELYLLICIKQYGSDSISMIASHMNMPVLTVSRMIANLETRSILQKNVKSSDHRVVLPALTEKGNDILNYVTKKINDFFAAEAKKICVPEEIPVTDYHKFDNSKKCICCFKPVFTITHQIIDLEFTYANNSFRTEFPASDMLVRSRLLSRIPVDNFNSILSICNKTMESGKPTENIVIANLPAKEYSYICSFDDAETIIFTVEHINSSSNTYVHELLSRYPYFFNSNTAKYILNHETGRILEINEAAASLYGLKHDELIRKTIFDISLSSQKDIRQKMEQAKKQTESIFHTIHRTAGGQVKDVEVHVSTALWGTTLFDYVTVILDTTNNRFGQISVPEKAVPGIEQRIPAFFATTYHHIVTDTHKLFEYVKDNGKICSYATGDHFFEYGTLLPTFAFMIDGLFKVSCISPSGRDYTLEYLRPGYVIDSLSFSNSIMSETIIIEAVVPGHVCIIDQNRIIGNRAQEQKTFEFLYYTEKKRIHRLEQRNLTLLTNNAKMKYEKFIENEIDIAGYLNGHDVASYLGITPETLSRIKKDISR